MNCVARAVVAAGSAVLLLGGCSGGDGSADDGSDGAAGVVVSSSQDGGPYAGIEVDPAFQMPEAELTDADGKPTTLPDDLQAPVRVFFYGYTNCPDVCPLVMSDLALAVARLPADVADQVEVVLVTSDPARDDPATLRAYLDRFDPEFTGLTGDLDTIVDVAADMGIAVADGAQLPSGGYEVTHGSQVIGYVEDRGVVIWTEGTSPEDIAADLVRMVGSAGGEG